MCTSFVSNRKKTIIGWNLDLLGMEYRVREADEGVFIEISDPAEGWLPLFGANRRGDFVGMPTCWPFDVRSNPKGDESSIILLDIDLLTQKKTFEEIRRIAGTAPVCSVPGVTYMGALSDKNGNVLHIIPGQGCNYYEKPAYAVLTNFSPFKGNSDQHPWMGWDRYHIAEGMLQNASDDFDVRDAFDILKAASQTACPTVVSMVLDAADMKVYWCMERDWEHIRIKAL